MRKGSLVAILVIMIGAFAILVVGQAMLKKAGPRVVDVAAILDGTVDQGMVVVRGIVDEVDPAAGEIYLKDLVKTEVCKDSVCMLPLIRVVTDDEYETGARASIRGRIAHDGDQPYLIAQGSE